MKKRTVTPKKRTVRRRKQQRLKKRQRSLQQRLARLAKAHRPFNSLAAALAKASASAITLVESEKLRQLPRLGKSPLNISTESQNSPHGFGLHSPVLQRPLSLRESLSLPQRLTSTLQVESTVARSEVALLWVVPRHCWPLWPVGRRPSPPECQLTHVGEPTLSAAGSSALLALTLPPDSKSIAVEPRAEKRFQEALPLPDFAPGVPATRRTAPYQKTPAAAKSKPASSDPAAASPPGAEQHSSDDETEWGGDDAIFKNLCTVYKSRRARPPSRKTAGFTSKPFRSAKKRSCRQAFSGTKKERPRLDQPMNFTLRLRGGSRTTSAGLGMKSVKFLGRRSLGEFHRRSIGRSDRQRRLSESTAVNHTDNRRHQFTPIAAVDTTLVAADKPLGAEQSPSDDGTEWVGRDATFKVYHQENCNFSQDGQPSFDDETEWLDPDVVFDVHYRKRRSLSQESLHSSTEERCPPAAMPLESDAPVLEMASETPFRWEGFDEEQLVAMQKLMQYMVATHCSMVRAMDVTGITTPGYENLYPYRTRPPTCLGADSPPTNQPTP